MLVRDLSRVIKYIKPVMAWCVGSVAVKNRVNVFWNFRQGAECYFNVFKEDTSQNEKTNWHQ